MTTFDLPNKSENSFDGIFCWLFRNLNSHFLDTWSRSDIRRYALWFPFIFHLFFFRCQLRTPVVIINMKLVALFMCKLAIVAGFHFFGVKYSVDMDGVEHLVRCRHRRGRHHYKWMSFCIYLILLTIFALISVSSYFSCVKCINSVSYMNDVCRLADTHNRLTVKSTINYHIYFAICIAINFPFVWLFRKVKLVATCLLFDSPLVTGYRLMLVWCACKIRFFLHILINFRNMTG